MLAGLAVCKKMTQIRTVMVVCSTALLILSGWLCMDFLAQRAAGNTAEMLYTGDWLWYAPLNIKLSVGVDRFRVTFSSGSLCSPWACSASLSLLTSLRCLCSMRSHLFPCTCL